MLWAYDLAKQKLVDITPSILVVVQLKVCAAARNYFDDHPRAIRAYVKQQRAVGRDEFRAMVEEKRRASPATGPRVGPQALPTHEADPR